MSYLEKLLHGVEVEWKTLSEVCEIIRGVRVTKKDLIINGKYPVVSGGIGYMGYVNEYNRDENTITIAQYGTAGYVKWQTEKFWANDVCFCVNPNIDIILNRYLYFYLINKQQYLYEISNRTAVPYSIDRNKILKLLIPIPPLSVQKEIVRILDTFTELTAELAAELAARKQQYSFYREELLDFSDQLLVDSGQRKVEWKTLGEVVNIKNGKDWKKLNAGDIPVYGSGGIMEYVDTFSYNKPTVLIPRKGSITNIFFVETPFWNVDTIYYTEINTNLIIPKFFYYFMKTLDLMKLDTGSGRPSLTQAILNQIKIPIPPLEEQERIVSILDKFDTLTNSISEGLPKEIELRQKQYEYYRNRLLTFPSLSE